MSYSTASAIHCLHCGSVTTHADYCCKGCETVHGLLQKGAAWDREELPHRFLKDQGDEYEVRFFIPGLDCRSCLGVLEDLPRYVPHVKSARLHVGESILTLRVNQGVSLGLLGQVMDALGVSAIALAPSEMEERVLKERRLHVARFIVAAASSGNIMLLALAVYAGAGPVLESYFTAWSAVVFLPLFIFSAWPFYEGAARALRRGVISIDVPMALAIGGGGVMSLMNAVRFGATHLGAPVYFDSISMLVTLLLGTRLLLREVEERTLAATTALRALIPLDVRRLLQAPSIGAETVPVSVLRPGDIIELRPGDVLPADGVLHQCSGWFNTATMDGEPHPRHVLDGESVLAGCTSVSGPIQVRVLKTGDETYVASILRLGDEAASQRPPLLLLAEQASRIFSVAVVAAAVAVFWFFGQQGLWHVGYDRTLALLMVSCPCALALAAPLAYARALGAGARHGLIIKGGAVLEKLARARLAVFDKTGTLTKGEMQVVHWEDLGADPQWVAAAVQAVEEACVHPVAAPLAAFARERARGMMLRASTVSEIVGVGARGVVGDRSIFIGAAVDGGSGLAVTVNGMPAARVTLRDDLREGVPRLMSTLREKGLALAILSGDGEEAVNAARDGAGLDPAAVEAVSCATPEMKAAWIKARRQRMGRGGALIFIGDGANDAAALGAADVGIAMKGGLAASLRAADVYVLGEHLQGVVTVLTLANRARVAILITLAFSVAYNIAASLGAVTGHIGPLFAAILMPLNSTLVLAITMGVTRAPR